MTRLLVNKNYCNKKMASSAEWCLIESDPGVFTELIRGFGKSDTTSILYCADVSAWHRELFTSTCSTRAGVQGAQVEELWGLDESNFENLK